MSLEQLTLRQVFSAAGMEEIAKNATKKFFRSAFHILLCFFPAVGLEKSPPSDPVTDHITHMKQYNLDTARAIMKRVPDANAGNLSKTANEAANPKGDNDNKPKTGNTAESDAKAKADKQKEADAAAARQRADDQKAKAKTNTPNTPAAA